MSKASYCNQDEKQWESIKPFKPWYTIQEVANIMGVGGPNVYGAIGRGTLPGYMVNSVKMVKHDDLIAYMARKGDAPVFDPSQLVITKIIPDKEAKKHAEEMLPDGSEVDFDPGDGFLDV